MTAGELLDLYDGPHWPPAGAGPGCRMCGRDDRAPFRKGYTICERCFEWAREFAAGRGRGTSPAPDRFFAVEKLKKALRRLDRGRQISDLALHYLVDRDNFRRRLLTPAQLRRRVARAVGAPGRGTGGGPRGLDTAPRRPAPPARTRATIRMSVFDLSSTSSGGTPGATFAPSSIGCP